MFGKASQRSFAEKWLLGRMSGETCEMMGMDMDGILQKWKISIAINLEGNPV